LHTNQSKQQIKKPLHKKTRKNPKKPDFYDMRFSGNSAKFISFNTYTPIMGVLKYVIILVLALFLISCQTEPVTHKIGVLVPLTGFGELGVQMQRGAVLARNEINNAGGINQKSIELFYENSECMPKVGLTGLKKLVEINKINIIIGPLCSSVALTVSPYAEEKKVLIMHGGLAPKLTEAGDYIFRPIPSAEVLAKQQAEFAEKYKTAAILYANNDFGVGYGEAFKNNFKGEITASEAFEQKEKDFRTHLSKINNPEAIMIIGGPVQMGTILKQMKELGIKAQPLLPPSAESYELLDIAGNAAEGMIYTYGFDAEKTEGTTSKFITAYKIHFNEDPTWHSALAYDAMYIYAGAMRNCNTHECIKNNIYKLTIDGAQGSIKFDENGDALLPITLKTVKDGKFVSYD